MTRIFTEFGHTITWWEGSLCILGLAFFAGAFLSLFKEFKRDEAFAGIFVYGGGLSSVGIFGALYLLSVWAYQIFFA